MMPGGVDRDLRTIFDTVADRYHDARPDYPERLFDDLVALAGLGDRSLLLEVGCGTAKATLPLARRGYRILALEPGPGLARVARQNLAGVPTVTVEEASFEAWEPAGRRFDMVYAATAWHWVEPDVRYAKAADVLRPGGILAFWGAGHGFPTGFDPFFTEIQAVYDKIGEGFPEPWPPPPPEEVADARKEIEDSGRFRVTAIRRYTWERWYTAEEYIALLDTFSGHLGMPVAKRELLYGKVAELLGRRPDGRVRRAWLAILHVATRT